MSKRKTYRVVIAQSVLTEHIVKAFNREDAEDKAYNANRNPKGSLAANQWLSDALETVDIGEVDA
jgi:hypothetical protein